MLTATKLCPRCQWAKPLRMFAPDRTKPAGVKSWCRACDNERARAYYAAHREERRAYHRHRNSRRPAAPPDDDSDRARILAGWSEATSWIAEQWHIVQRIERTLSAPQWDAAMRRALDRAEAQDAT